MSLAMVWAFAALSRIGLVGRCRAALRLGGEPRRECSTRTLSRNVQQERPARTLNKNARQER
jgi:hypothetical protein